MAIITMPDGLRCARGSRIEQISFNAGTTSDASGASQARAYGAPKWALSLVAPEALADLEAGIWKALALQLRGGINHLAAYDPTRPEPLGTLRGAPTLSAACAIGDTAMQLAAGAGQAAKNLVAGDWLQIGAGLGTSQLVMVVAPAVADGAGAISLMVEPPLRMAFSSGSACTLVRARGYFRMSGARVGWGAVTRRHTQGLALDLVEAW